MGMISFEQVFWFFSEVWLGSLKLRAGEVLAGVIIHRKVKEYAQILYILMLNPIF